MGAAGAVGTADNSIRYLKSATDLTGSKPVCDDPENFLGRYLHYNTVDKRKAAVDYLAQHGSTPCTS